MSAIRGNYETDTTRFYSQGQKKQRLPEKDVQQGRTESNQSPQSQGSLQAVAFGLIVLPAAERLRKSGLFQRVYAAKKSISAPLFTLYVLERQPRSAPRLPLVGFVIGKKVESKACLRNRAKRRVREAYRRVRQSFDNKGAVPGAICGQAKYNLQQWYAIIWVIKNEILTAGFDDICASVQECVEKAAGKYGRKSVQR